MNVNVLCIVSIRVASMFILFHAIEVLLSIIWSGSVVYFWKDEGSDIQKRMLFFNLSLFVLKLILCGGLWIFSKSISRLIVAGMDRSEILPLRFPEAMHLVFLGSGIFILFTVISPISTILAAFLEANRLGSEFRWHHFHEHILRTVLGLIFGLWLIFGSGRIQKILINLRKL